MGPPTAPYARRVIRHAGSERCGAPAGTFAYAAPELLTGFKCNEKADIWCACCTRAALRMLCLGRSVVPPLGCVHTVSPVRHISERGLGKLLSHNLQQQAAGARFELAALCCNSGDRRWKSSLRA